MRFIAGCLLLLLLVSSLSPAHGVLEANNVYLRCRCTKTASLPISLKFIARVSVFPPSSGCSVLEVIIWLKNKSALCLNPKLPWTQHLLENIHNLVKNSQLPAPVKTKKT
ncbi:PREDICTED: C-X-C motif chemokine 13 [Miniopterus natalensis]|uniref:C-X-C motif chemokine 13 n=1 Tax=Miniopterus natalensis TaxID=291302 RepID=UPI0007A6D3DB|nr:PREDICTED: C-X-C motif chemokine 13 [Miniopterus natalensis]